MDPATLNALGVVLVATIIAVILVVGIGTIFVRWLVPPRAAGSGPMPLADTLLSPVVAGIIRIYGDRLGIVEADMQLLKQFIVVQEAYIERMLDTIEDLNNGKALRAALEEGRPRWETFQQKNTPHRPQI